MKIYVCMYIQMLSIPITSTDYEKCCLYIHIV